MQSLARRPKRWKNLRDTGILHSPYFNIASITPSSLLSPNIVRWIRNAQDERAAQEGSFFSEESGAYTVDWIEEYCMLYEGDQAGRQIRIDDWQYESIMQLFGWKVVSPDPRFLGQEVRRHRVGHIWVPKKNKKSPTAAAIGTFLLIGDGEPGQKIFSAAADGKQALIAHRHAMNMIEQNPILSNLCHFDKRDGDIHYFPTNSMYSVVSGKNKRGQQGLNGSVLIDEVHVVDSILYDALQYAGASRKEPFLLTFSTAGDDAASLGFDLYKKSLSIQKGTQYQPNTYVSVFGDVTLERNPSTGRPLSPEDWYDEKIVLSLVRKSNPAIGSTVSEHELMSTWKASTRSLTELARWKKYRTNVWPTGEAGWLNPSDYNRCQKAFTLQEMKCLNAPCSLGLDLSKVGDTTALSATFSVKTVQQLFGDDGAALIEHGGPVFRDKFIPYQMGWSWIPESTARRRLSESDINFSAWDNEVDNVTICEGRRTVPYESVAQRIVWLWDNFDVRGLGYDSWNSNEIVGKLVDEHGINPADLLRVPQNMPIMHPMTQQFEKLILDGEIVLQPSAYLNWQFNNVQLQYDAGNNYKPRKPSADSPQAIDLIIASIMSSGMFHLPELRLTNEPIGSISSLVPGTKYGS